MRSYPDRRDGTGVDAFGAPSGGRGAFKATSPCSARLKIEERGQLRVRTIGGQEPDDSITIDLITRLLPAEGTSNLIASLYSFVRVLTHSRSERLGFSLDRRVSGPERPGVPLMSARS
jgi:hypothetical protein